MDVAHVEVELASSGLALAGSIVELLLAVDVAAGEPKDVAVSETEDGALDQGLVDERGRLGG